MVCPYCGRQRINVASLPGKRPSKPPIDHFLPKRKYPFLAVSFYNLIPCCTNCNELANKGDFDPLEGDLGLEIPMILLIIMYYLKVSFLILIMKWRMKNILSQCHSILALWQKGIRKL